MFILSPIFSGLEFWSVNYILILYAILFSILFTYILIEGLSVFSPCFLKISSKQYWISDIEYYPSGNSNSWFLVGADILNLLFLYDFLIFLHVFS